jgi:hypothetical protein
VNEGELLSNWAEQKLSTNYQRLIEPLEVEFEFCRAIGHPSQYALVRLSANPADQLSLEFEVDWPKEFDVIYTLRIKHSIGEAAVDGLLSSSVFSPFRGCDLRLIKFGWHEVSGSEASVRIATTHAIEKLRKEGKWEEVTGRYRKYTSGG